MPKSRKADRPRSHAKHSAPAPTAPHKPVLIPAAAKVLSARQVRELLGGKSEMFLYRLLTERPQLNFPRPFKINERNHWHRADVEAWILAQQPIAA